MWHHQHHRQAALMSRAITIKGLQSYVSTGHIKRYPTICHMNHKYLHISSNRFTQNQQSNHVTNNTSSKSSSELSSTNQSSSSSSSSPRIKQYWRSHNIAKHIIQQEKSKSGETNESVVKKSSNITRYIRTFKRGSITITRGFIDIIVHPSHIHPLMQRLWIATKHEAHHYWSGTKLLGAEVRTAYKLVRKTTKGHTLTRRERRQLRRTSQDLMRIVPFSVFVLVPFLELALPIALKVFPNMLPSTYQTASSREQQLKRELQARLNVAGFLQESMESLAKQQTQAEDPSIKTSAEQLLNILKAVRTGQRVKTDDLARVAALFDNEITLDSFNHHQLVLICKLLSIPVVGTDEMMRYAIDLKIRRIHRDDAVIARDSIDSLDDEELRAACRARGMRDFGLTRYGYQRNLQQWLDLSLNKQIPDSLLLLSRALSISEQPSAEDIRSALTSLSEQSLDEWATSAGISDNEQKLALIRRQNELIAQEEETQKRQDDQRREKEKSDVKPTESDAIPVKNEATEVALKSPSATSDVVTEKQDIGTLIEAILSMSQSSAVALERERLEEMIARVEQDQREEAEQALIKNLRPRIASAEGGKKQQHPIQTLDDLAKWNAFQHQYEPTVSTPISTRNQAEQQSPSAETQKIEEIEEKDEEEESSRQAQQLRTQLMKQLKKLQDRISEIDAEIGNKLQTVQTDSLGRIEDAELHRALKKLTGGSDEFTQQVINQIKDLVKNSGHSNVQLTIDDIKRLAQMQQEESKSE